MPPFVMQSYDVSSNPSRACSVAGSAGTFPSVSRGPDGNKEAFPTQQVPLRIVRIRMHARVIRVRLKREDKVQPKAYALSSVLSTQRHH